MTSTRTVTGQARVTVVTAPDCHFCEDALSALDAVAQAYPLAVEEVAADTPAGRALLGQHRTGMFPLVLIDGGFFSAGRLPRRKLARLLTARGAAAAAGPGAR